jgi:hypothetical protein
MSAGAIGLLATACSHLPSSRSIEIGEKPSWTNLKKSCDWQYQHTYDNTTRLGRSPNALSITRGTITAYLQIPRGCRIKSCADGPLNWHYGVYSEGESLSLGVSLDTGVGSYESYLAGIHDTHDDNVKMLPAQALKLNNGSTVVPYEYFSSYWGHRLVVKVPKEEFTTTFEFYAKTRPELRQQRELIERVIESFRYLEYSSTGSPNKAAHTNPLPVPSRIL